MLRTATVLVMASDERVRRAMAATLTRVGRFAVSSHDGSAPTRRAAIAVHAPDILVLGMLDGEPSAAELIRTIPAPDDAAGTAVVAVIAAAERDEVRAAGADAVLQDDDAPEVLAATVGWVADRREALAQSSPSL